MSTILEILKNQYNFQIGEKFSSITKGNNELLLSFSIIRNTRSLFASKTTFEALDTMKLFLIINVHIAHIYTFTTSLGFLTLKKNFSVTVKLFYDNKYIFMRNTIIIDALFTIRFVLIKFSKIEQNFINWFNFFSLAVLLCLTYFWEN